MVQESGLGAGKSPAEQDVWIEDEEKANLTCYFLRSLLKKNSGGKTGAHLSSCFERGVGVKAGGMEAFIYRSGDGICVSPICKEKPGITVEGDLNSLLRVLLGGGVVLPYLKGEIRVGGNLIGALRMLGLLRIPKSRRE